MNMRDYLKSLYQKFLSLGSNISALAEEEKVTNTDCYNMVKMGERYTKEDE